MSTSQAGQPAADEKFYDVHTPFKAQGKHGLVNVESGRRIRVINHSVRTSRMSFHYVGSTEVLHAPYREIKQASTELGIAAQA